MYRQTSKKQTHKHHDRSLDDFLKHIKKYNLKSQRYDRLLSPDQFAPYRQNTTHTLDRSRTLSGKHSKKTNKTTRQRVEKLLTLSKEKQKGSASSIISKSKSAINLPNPADLISDYSKKIREAEHLLNGKSKMGLLLCKKFLHMLNQLVQNMVLNLQQNLEELQKSIYQRLQKEIGEQAELRAASLQRKVSKLQRQSVKLMEKQNYNSNLIYHLRMQNIDVDRAFGQCIYGSDQFGGFGYNKKSASISEESLNNLSSSEMIFVKRNKEEGADPIFLDHPQDFQKHERPQYPQDPH